jgi:hypothetical protein
MRHLNDTAPQGPFHHSPYDWVFRYDGLPRDRIEDVRILGSMPGDAAFRDDLEPLRSEAAIESAFTSPLNDASLEDIGGWLGDRSRNAMLS